MRQITSFRPPALWALSWILVSASASAAVDPDLLAGLKARSIGPAVASGRIADVQISPSDPDVIYAGAASGGVWRSTDGGLTWKPIFDDQPVASIGSLALHATNPDLSAFHARGGKLLMLENMADYAQSPYAGIGYDASFFKQYGLSLSLDAGVIVGSKPQAKVSTTGAGVSQTDRLAEQKKVETDVAFLRYYPVVMLSAKYRF